MSEFPAITRKAVSTNGITIHIDGQGSGRPLLILHGASGPQSVANFAAAMGSQTNVLVPTHPGFAGEPRPEWCTDVDDLALIYRDLLATLDLHEVIVVGFSFGGWIAAELAVRETARLGGLILVDAAGIQVDGHDIMMPSSRPSTGQPLPPSPNPEELQSRMANRQAIEVYSREGLYNPKLRRRLAYVKIPTLAIWGENDPIMDLDYGRAYAQSFPNGRFAVIPEAGHFPQIDQPEHLNNLVHEFVASVPPFQPTTSPAR